MTKKLLATSFLAGIVAFGPSLIHHASAAQDPELSFYPAQKWVIESADATRGSNAPVCTLSNTFNNGFSVQFAGTHEGFANINIDFRQPTFEKNMPYEVVYSVPGSIEKTIPTKAFKKNLLVSDLRGQKDFSDALRSASVVDIKIRKNSFRLYLTGLAASMKDYTACVEPAGAVAAIDEVAAPVDETAFVSFEAAPMPDNNVLDAAVVEEPVVASSSSLVDRLAQKIREEKQVDISAQAASEIAPASGTPEPADVAALETASQSYSIKTPRISVQRETSRMEADFTSIDEENSLTAQPASMPASEMIDAVASIEEKPAISEKTIAALQDIEPGSGMASGGEDFLALRQKISDLESQVYKLQNENKALNEEIKISLKDAEEERLSVASDNWNLERATMRFNEAERQISRLGRQLQSQKAQCDQEKQELETMLFDPQVTNQQQLATLSSLEEELDQARNDLLRQQRKYEERIKILEEQLGAP